MMGGEPCIADTRMPVREFLIHLEQGGSIDTFIRSYGSEPDELRSVLRFAVHDLDEDRRVADRAQAWAQKQARELDRSGDGIALP